jgi:uncharacterized protein (TIGR03118 family)
MRQVFRRAVLSGLILLPLASARGDLFVQTNIVSDIPGMAPVTDPNLKNPWGIALSSTSPFWVANQGSNTATLYYPLGSPIKQGLTVTTVTAGTGPPMGPTGQVFNSTAADFMIPAPGSTFVKSTFLFDTLDGTIQGWNPGSNAGLNATETVATVPRAIFTGLALAASGGSNFLYAAERAGPIDVFDSKFSNVTGTTFAGKFVDPSPVAGFTPYNIQFLGGALYVTYAATGTAGAPLPGGYVDKFDTAGNFLGRIATGGPINAPWGLAIAPAGFGTFGGDLLVGNLFDSKINAYNLSTLALEGSITVKTGFASPVGLWALNFGNGTTGDPNTLYFTSGINDQRDGLFGAISSVPEPGPLLLFVVMATALLAVRAVRRRAA